MPLNPISVGMKVYALQLKQKSTAAGFNGILRKTRSASLKGKQKRRGTRSDPCGSRFSLFPWQLLSLETIVLLGKVSHSVAFHFGLCYTFL